ncbi:MAG: hypothetical protein ACRCZI_01005 [Cetobacterium sp.]
MEDITATDVQNIEPTGQPSQLSHDALCSTLKTWFKVDMAHSGEWRSQAREDFDFVAGDQWSPADKAALEDQKRPVITFNRALSIIKAVAGIEINGRHDTVFLPRGTQAGVVKVNELLTSASQWMSDVSDAEDEQSAAFQDAIICGMGWTEARISYDEDRDGQYCETKIDPLEMFWDRSATAKNLKDARRVFRVRKMTLDEARDFASGLGANVFDDDLDATWAVGADTSKATSVEERRFRGRENTSAFDPSQEVHIVHAQWIEREPVYRVADRTTGRMLELDQQRFDEYTALAADHGLAYTYVRQTRKVYKQAFLGRDIIGDVMPCPGRDRFTFQCITGERHRNKGTWFGLIRLMRDPQMWANKWLSQTLHILNTTAKGGIIAEKDAFEDVREAQDTYAQPDAITWVKAGAVSNGKIMQKPGVGIPTAYVNLLEFAIASIRDVTGINLELLGMRDANQPGILEHQRKQAAMTILATMFDNLRAYRKNIGRVRLHFIQNYLADGRLIRITQTDPSGQEVMVHAPLLRDQTLGDYEVIIDDAPTSPNQKQETWAFLMQLMPVFRGFMTPEAAVAMLEYSPLPSKLVEALKQMVSQTNQPSPEAIEAQQIGKMGQIAKIDRDKAAADKDRATADGARAQAVLDLANAAQSGADASLKEAQADVIRSIRPTVRNIAEPYVIEPQGVNSRSLPRMPQAPTLPSGLDLPDLPLAKPDAAPDMAALANALNGAAANN